MAEVQFYFWMELMGKHQSCSFEKISLYGDLIHGKLFLQGERGEKQIRS